MTFGVGWRGDVIAFWYYILRVQIDTGKSGCEVIVTRGTLPSEINENENYCMRSDALKLCFFKVKIYILSTRV